MSSRSCWRASLLAAAFTLLATPAAGRAPAWLRDLADVPVPPQKETVDAVQLLSDVEVEVRADGRVRKRVRAAYRILKPVGETRVIAQAVYDSRSRVRSMQAWTIPAKGAHLESDMSAAADAALSTMGGAELVNDIRQKVLVVPVGGAGAVSGYEYEMDISPLAPADSESFQNAVPVIEARYSLLVPRGWQVTATWLHHPDVEPVRASDRQWQWTLRDLPAIEPEARMPSPASIAARLQVAFTPAGAVPQLSTWQGIGSWYAQLAQERLAPNDAIRAKVAELTRNQGSALARFRALAGFVQSDIRYVAIELGIGGFQPHAATDVFANRFGDCKDKVTLLGTMLREVGIDSVPVLVNTDRTMLDPRTPPALLFNHVILAVLLPREQLTPDILAAADAPDGRVLVFFDPTDEISPVGRIAGALQASWGLIATSDGSRLAQLPRMAYRDNGLRRTAQLKLDDKGVLSGNFTELFTGDLAGTQRWALRSATREADLIKPVEALLASSMAAYRVTSAQASNRTMLEQPLEWRYSVVADAYARRAGELLMVRPRVLGSKAEQFGASTTRVHDMLFPEARLDQDEILIELPPGFTVDSLPEPVDIDVGFAAYRSRTELAGAALKYTRSYELRELRITAAQVAEFQRLHAAIARDERAMAILKAPAAK
jgi:transglutaminase-like putative cysteine protease